MTSLPPRDQAAPHILPDDPSTDRADSTGIAHRAVSTVNANRRRFIGGVLAIGAMLGLYPIRTISAQQATPVTDAVDDYVWTPPAYDPEPALFTIMDRTEEEITVETIDGLITIPAHPQRVVSLGWEYVALFELGLAERLVGVGYRPPELSRAGDLTDDLHAALEHVELLFIDELDLEQIVLLKPDLILASPLWTEDISALSEIAPTIRGLTSATDVPRAAVRDFGALFDRESVAVDLIAEHDAFIERAKQTLAPAIVGKKAITVYPYEQNLYAYPSYYLANGGVFALAYGPYQLHRELGITPSSFVERIADEDERQHVAVEVSVERMNEIDADYLFVNGTQQEVDAFVANTPTVALTVAGQNNQLYPYDSLEVGFGLPSVRAAVALIVEQITGEPFA
ncbi:MAG: ABC transporter substrate-binding protein [Thermomicrobiales bacterium]